MKSFHKNSKFKPGDLVTICYEFGWSIPTKRICILINQEDDDVFFPTWLALVLSSTAKSDKLTIQNFDIKYRIIPL